METGEQDQRDMIVFFLRINDSFFFEAQTCSFFIQQKMDQRDRDPPKCLQN
jgi:hypothetical protein